MRIKNSLFTSLLCALLLPAPVVAQPTHSKFRLGFIAPFSGPAQLYGDAPKNGLELALDEIGRDWIEVIYENDEFSTAKTVAAFRKLTSVDKVDAVVCVASTPCNAVAPLAQQKRIPLFAWASDVKVSKGRTFVLRTYPSGADEGKEVAEEAIRREIKDVALVTSTNDYSDSWRDGFERSFPPQNLLAKEEVPHDSRDFRAFILRAVSRNASQFAVCLDPGQSASFAKQTRQIRPEAKIFGCLSLNDQSEVSAAAGALDGAWFATTSVSDKFREKYLRRFGNDSVISGAAVYYDLTYLLRDALKTDTTTDLMSRLVTGRELQGAVGKFKVAQSYDDQHFDIMLTIEEVRPTVNNG